MFNKPSKWTEQDFKESRAYSLLCDVDTKMWVEDYQMSEQEKIDFPSHKTTGGYLRDIPFKDAFKNRWSNWDDRNKEAFTSLPNFDAEVFEAITGVKI